MEKQKLPNVTLALVLGILSLLCCCFGGLPALIVAAIAFFLVRKDEKSFEENPELYEPNSNLKVAKIIAIVGMVLGLIYFIYTLFVINQFGGWEGYMNQVQEMQEQWGM